MVYRFEQQKSVKPVCTLALLLLLGHQNVMAKTMVYGIDNAHHFASHAHGPFYVQVAAFSSASNAKNYIHNLTAHCKYSITLKQHGAFHAVIVGPIASANEVRALSAVSNMSPLKLKQKSWVQASKPILTSKKTLVVKKEPFQQSVMKDKTSTKSFLMTHGFVQADLGYTTGSSTGNFEVFNGAVDPYPANVDVYSINHHKHGSMVSLLAGLRWQQERDYLPAYSLALRYQNLFNQRIAGTIMQYSDPDFLNYNYQWKFNSNVFSVYSKVNLAKSHNVLPYVSAGVGSAANKSGRYHETALSGIVARSDSPDFASQSKRQFTYTLGAGLDYQLNKKMLMSVGYEFQDLGAVHSGYGQSPWSADRFVLNRYKTNSVLLSLSYLPGA